MNWKKVRRVVRRVWVTAGLLFTGWMVWSFQAHGVPREALASSDRVIVERGDGSLRFLPRTATGATGASAGGAGLIFLPGGMVDPEAYVPMARVLAELGHPVAIIELPFRVAPSDEAEGEVATRAREARAAMGEDLPWLLAGHSRGAAIATRLAAVSPAEYDGIALVGTTHPRVNLSRLPVPVWKIGGTRDCVAPRERSEEAAPMLPARTEWRWIEGANHAQFGWYGSQLGDCGATIDRAEQQQELVRILGEILAELGAPAVRTP